MPKSVTDTYIEEQTSRWTSRFSAAESAQQELFNQARSWYDAFYGVFNQKVAPWRSKVVDPKIAQATLNVIYKVVNTDPQPFVDPNHQNDFQSARNAQALLEWDVNNPLCEEDMFKRRFSVICDAAVTGTGFALLPWELEEYELKRRNKTEDGKVSLSEDKIKKTKIGYTEFEPISFFRMFIEPGATSLHEAEYVIYLDFKSLKDLKESASEDKGYIMSQLTKLEDVKPSGSNSNLTQYEQSRNKLVNVTTSNQSGGGNAGKFQIKVCYDSEEKRFYYFAEDILYRVEDNPYWHGKFPGNAYYLRPRAHSVFGDGFFERVMRVGAANDAVMNQFMDQLSLSINGLIMHDESTTIDANVMPGGDIIYSGVKPEMISIPQPDISGVQLAQQNFQRIIEENTLSGYETGNPNTATDKTSGTKGGIVAIQQAGNDKLRFMAKMMGSCYRVEFNMRLSNIMQFFDRKRAVRILGEAGELFPVDISPEDIHSIGSYDVRVEFDLEKVVNSDVEAQKKLNAVDRIIAIAAAAQQSGQPVQINWGELARMAAEAFDFQGIDRVIEPAPAMNDSPENENKLFLMGKLFEPSETDDHEYHIQIHEELLSDPGIHKKVRANLGAHYLRHKQLLAEQVKQQAFQEATAPKLDSIISQNEPIPNAEPLQIQGGLPTEAQAAGQPGQPGTMAPSQAPGAQPA